MNFLAQFFLKNHKFTVVVMFFVVFYGLSGLFNIKSESFPSVNIGAVVITTMYPGATAEDIETKITKPIEEEIQKVSGLKKVRSNSQAGFSTIVTEVDIDKYDVEKVISDLQRAVDRSSGLPTDLESRPLFTEIKSDEFPVVELAVVGSNEGRIRDEAADSLREDLKDNKKISGIILVGFRERQFNILLNREKMIEEHVSISEVKLALAQRNITIPGGEIKGDKDQKLVRIEGKAQTAQELDQIVVRSNFSGQKVLLGDIAQVEDSAKEPTTLTRHNGIESTNLVISKKGGADLLELVREIEDVIAGYNEKYKGRLQFLIFNSEGIRVSNRLDVLTSNGWQGLLLVVITLIIFVRGPLGLATAVALPISLFFTLGVVYSIGYTLNTITIIGFVIALGMLIDNSVVVSENFMRLKYEGFETVKALEKTIADFWAPVLATTLTTVAAFMPMLVTTGVMGQFIKGIPIVVSLALMISVFESFFLLPTRIKLLPEKWNTPKSTDGDWFDKKIVPLFERQMEWLVDNKYKSAALFSGFIFVSIFILSVFGKINLFPADQTEIYISRLQTPTGTRIEETDRIAKDVVEQIKKEFSNEVLHIVQTSGESAVDPADVKGEVGSNSAMIKIFVSRETQDNKTTKEMLDRFRKIKNDQLKRITFEALVNGPPVGDPVSVTFRSNDMLQLSQVAEHIKSKIASVPGIIDAKVNDVVGDDEVFVEVDYSKAARLGLSLQDIGLSVRTAIAGQKMGDVNINNKDVDYFVRFEDKDKASLDQLGQVKIADHFGNLIPLERVAQFKTQTGAPQVKRFDFKRSKSVTASIDDTVINSIQANKIILDEFEQIKNKFKDVNIVFAGEAEKTNESINSLFNALILSLIGIFALLVLIFRSYSSPFIIMTTIPFGLVGISWAFTLHQKPLSFMALIGIIGVGGIIVNAGIILVDVIEKMRDEAKMSLREILIKSSGLRLRAVLVTSITSIIGLLPTAYGIGGVDYFIIPMALAIAWGLSTGTLFTLYWVPPAYAIVEELKSKFQRRGANAR